MTAFTMLEGGQTLDAIFDPELTEVTSLSGWTEQQCTLLQTIISGLQTLQDKLCMAIDKHQALSISKHNELYKHFHPTFHEGDYVLLADPVKYADSKCDASPLSSSACELNALR